MPHILNQFDHRIPGLVQYDCKSAAQVAATEIGLSKLAVQCRLKRLRAAGIILRQIAVRGPRGAGRSMTFIAAAEIKRGRPKLMEQLGRWLDAEDSLQLWC